MTRTLQLILKISRPRFWLYLGGTYLVGYTFGINSIQKLLDLNFILNLSYFTIIANILLYGINDYFDFDTDQFNAKKDNQEHLLKKTERQLLKKTLIVVGVISLLFLANQQQSIIQLLFVAFLGLSIFYSAPPLRFKAHPFVDFLSNSLYILPGLIGYYQATESLPSSAIALAFFCWAFAMHLFSAIPDIAADKQAHLTTTAVLLGKNSSLLLCAILWIAFSSILLCSARFPFNYFSLLTIIYPAIPISLLINKNIDLNRTYWLFPYLNSIAGFILFLIAANGK